MKRAITYGTFDLLHHGHLKLLRRAKTLGDFLIPGLSTDEFNRVAKHKHCYCQCEYRKELLEALRCVDLVIPDESWEQKRRDLRECRADVFVMGDDWAGKFDFLREAGVAVVPLPRTPDSGSTHGKIDLESGPAIAHPAGREASPAVRR